MELFTWLRMRGFPRDGFYVPDGRTEYEANLDIIDAVMPSHGGELQTDGSWLQVDCVLDTQFSQDLPAIAESAGQLYMPQMFALGPAMEAVLGNSSLWATVANGITNLATTRFDAPWAGVALDLEDVRYEDRTLLRQFLYYLGYRLHNAGLKILLSVPGRWQHGTGPLDAYDYLSIAQVADYMDVRCYGYWFFGQSPLSIAPHWYIRACIEHALDNGLLPQRLLIGLGNISMYWEVTGQSQPVQIQYEEAKQLVTDNNSFVQWIERNESGLVRERYADIGEGHIWIHDGDTYRHSLNLIKETNLLGACLFIPGMGDTEHWTMLQEFR